jgi:hypothetical protein
MPINHQSLGWDGNMVFALNADNDFGYGDLYIQHGQWQSPNDQSGNIMLFSRFPLEADGTSLLFTFKLTEA